MGLWTKHASRSCAVAVALGVVAFVAPVIASADGNGDTMWLTPIGLNVGVGHHPHGPTGAVVGAEASVVGVRSSGGHMFAVPTGWGGAYVDAVYDTATSRGRFSIGPEIGYMLLGLDGGFVAQVGGGTLRAGYAVRPLLAFGPFLAYARFAFVPGDEIDRTTEVGLLAKWPLAVRSAEERASTRTRERAYQRLQSVRIVRWWLVEDAARGPAFVVELEGDAGIDVMAYLNAHGPRGTSAQGGTETVRLGAGRIVLRAPIRRMDDAPPTSYELSLRVTLDDASITIDNVTPGGGGIVNARALPPPSADAPPSAPLASGRCGEAAAGRWEID